MRFGEGGVILYESAIRLKVLLPKSAINFHIFCSITFKAIAELLFNQLQAELFVRDDGSQEERLGNQNRFYTYVSKMPSNGKFYIASTSHAFKQCICDCLGSVHDCCVLQSKSLNVPFENSDSQNVPQIVHDSNEE